MVNNITLAKGAYSVTIHTGRVAEDYSNKIFIISPIQSSKNQSEGEKKARIVDLLRLNHSIVFQGYITNTSTQTAKQVKDDLINIFKGGGINGGTVELTYGGNTFEGFIEKFICTEESQDSPTTDDEVSGNPDGMARYELSITFVEGESI